MTSEATVPTASNCCVLLVCGAPGSGKSTLARFLHTEFEERSINSHILSFDDYEVPSTVWDSETFTQSRQVSLLALENLLHEQQYRVLIVDDIMFYCGMRKKVYQLARQHGAGYAVVHVDVPIAVAQARNTTRSEDTRVHPKVRYPIYYCHNLSSYHVYHITMTIPATSCHIVIITLKPA